MSEIPHKRESSKNLSLRIELYFSQQLFRSARQSDTYPGLPQTSSMKSFARIVNGLEPVVLLPVMEPFFGQFWQIVRIMLKFLLGAFEQ